MANAPLKPCGNPKCPKLGCTEPSHQVEAWRTRCRPIVHRIRGRALQKLRQQLIARSPQCATCRCPLTLKTLVRDHTIPLAEGGRDDATNEQALCGSCSTTKTQAESARGVARR